MMMEEEVGKCPTVTVPASGPEAPHASVKAKHGGAGGEGQETSYPSYLSAYFPHPQTGTQWRVDGWMGREGWVKEEITE